MATPPSPFLEPGPTASNRALGILQLRRDHLIPVVLSSSTDSDYAEGKVENTRFGSYPHSTIIGQPWGTQILASKVDTGSRSSRSSKSKKRKREASDDDDDTTVLDIEPAKDEIAKAARASSGFAHLVPPTPEVWTLCLPHRTQVVYTPDYSYILQRLRARPGDHIIEAGAGSGSFTHAAVRAIYNGQDSEEGGDGSMSTRRKRRRKGQVYSFEYHAPRAEQLAKELGDHGLGAHVTVTNRDVYEEGFCFGDNDGPDADIIFLDLPAPWLALKHLTRSPPSQAALKALPSNPSTPTAEDSTATDQPETVTRPFKSPLNPKNAVRICTFSPCIEQVTKTVSAMRSLGWLEIGMAEIQAKRLEVRRERIGLQEEGQRGANPNAATVQEAVQRLRDVEGRAKVFHGMQKDKQEAVMRRAEARKCGEQVPVLKEEREAKRLKLQDGGMPQSKHDRLEQAKRDRETRYLFKEGRLVHRTEAELKTHTSYLVFAILPREWTKEDEARARSKWTKSSNETQNQAVT